MCVSIMLLVQDFEFIKGGLRRCKNTMSMQHVWTPTLNGSSALQHFECDIVYKTE